MAEFQDREHYIPLRKADLIELLCRDKKTPRESLGDFRQFCKLVSAIYHFEYLEKLEDIKNQYAPFDPDSRMRLLRTPDTGERDRHLEKLFQDFSGLLEKANFKHLTDADIQGAVEGGASDWGINMYVDFKLYERLELFVRGEGKVTRTRRHRLWFWKQIEKKVDCYERLVFAVKLRKSKRLPKDVDVNRVFFKLFKDIPKLDLEMVLPGSSLQMPRATRGKLGASLLGTIGYAVYKVWTDILLAAKVVAQGALTAAGTVLWGPFLLLAGYGYKQYAGYQITKQTYSKQLTESLYYQTLDNNAGVLTRLLDEAEEQECREAILAYYHLWLNAPPQGWTAEQLDDYVEMYLEGVVGLKVDFEIGDALDKVERLGIVTRSGGMHRAVPLAQALEKLDHRWDNYFQYNKA
jgi:hypothetical protein